MKPSLILKRICRRKGNNPKAKCTIAMVKSSIYHTNKLVFMPTIESIYEIDEFIVIKYIKI